MLMGTRERPAQLSSVMQQKLTFSIVCLSASCLSVHQRAEVSEPFSCSPTQKVEIKQESQWPTVQQMLLLERL